jgi:hypothetical protein
VLHRSQRLRPRQPNVAHVADIEDAHARAHRHVLVDDSAADRRGILHGHVPAVEVDHLRAHLAMDGVQRGLADDGSFNVQTAGVASTEDKSKPQSASSQAGLLDV